MSTDTLEKRVEKVIFLIDTWPEKVSLEVVKDILTTGVSESLQGGFYCTSCSTIYPAPHGEHCQF